MLLERYLREVPLPEDLTQSAVFQAMARTQNVFTMIRERAGIKLPSIIQANNFSGVVSNVFSRMLGEVSAYHPFSDQRYPDLMHESKEIGLEVKASNKPMKGGEGHNGWHIVACFTVLPNDDIEFIQLEIACLIGFERDDSDWKYMGSRRNANNSQRTETYVTTSIGTAKLRDGSVYLNPEHVHISSAMIRGRERLGKTYPPPPFSPLYREG
ncbi:MAG: hypothetical protein IJ702_06060 [Fretibacterium sp.]|nr:hypothetical protein [Fretibacterium sp.]